MPAPRTAERARLEHFKTEGRNLEKGYVPQLEGFYPNEEQHIRAVLQRSGLPLHDIPRIYKFRGTVVRTKNKRSGWQVIDEHAVYNHDGSIGLSAALWTTANDTYTIEECIIHEIGHLLSPIVYEGSTQSSIAARKNWRYKFASARTYALLDRVNAHCAQRGQFVSPNHGAYYSQYYRIQHANPYARTRLYDETFACLTQALYCKPEEFLARLNPSDAREFVEIMCKISNVSKDELEKRIQAVRIMQYN